MDFIKKRVRKFQEKKLNEILSKIQFHEYLKNELEQKLKHASDDKISKILEEIESNDKMIKIWQKNEDKLRRQMDDLDD